MTNPRLLLVDDDPDVGLVVRILARRAGHDLTHFPDAESAWAGLDAARADLILLDSNLPGMGGLEFLRRLRASPPHARSAVALFGQPELTRDIADAWAAGADYHVSKELVTRPDAWKRRLDEIVAHLRGRASGTSLFLQNVIIPVADAEAPATPPRFPPLDGMSAELFRVMRERAGADPATPAESRARLLHLIDQVGCLFGGAAVEKIVKLYHAESMPTEPRGP